MQYSERAELLAIGCGAFVFTVGMAVIVILALAGVITAG